jgi:hypothetical protein
MQSAGLSITQQDHEARLVVANTGNLKLIQPKRVSIERLRVCINDRFVIRYLHFPVTQDLGNLAPGNQGGLGGDVYRNRFPPS